jgi:histidinol-phosphatase (PHP family)
MIDGFFAADYHVHSLRSHDGGASIAEMCRRAYEIGVAEIGFSEHKDFDPDDPVLEFFDYDAYMADIEACREEYGRILKIRAGVEIDYQSWFEDKITDFLDRHPFDFVIGSVHCVQRMTVMSPEYNRNRDRRTAYTDYFKAVRESVCSGLFDVLGHLEYANKAGIRIWGPYDATAFKDELEDIFDCMAARSIALELNSAGIRHGLRMTYPSRRTLDLYTAHGYDLISLGSDAHAPDEVTSSYTDLVRTALAAGLTQVCVWENRKRTLEALRPSPRLSVCNA